MDIGWGPSIYSLGALSDSGYNALGNTEDVIESNMY